MKICHVVSGDLWAGAEAVVFNLIEGLSARSGVDLSVIVLNDGRLYRSLRKLGIPVYLLDESRIAFPALVRRVADVLRTHGAEVAHSHRYKENFLVHLASRFSARRVGLVATQHGMPEMIGRVPSVAKRLTNWAHYRLLATSFDVVVAVSSDIRGRLVEGFGLPASSVSVIRNGVRLPDAGRERAGGTTLRVGSAGRFVPVKDFGLLVEIARSVRERTDSVRFVLAGEGPEMQRVQDAISRYDLGAVVELRGFVEQMQDFYLSIDAYINTSCHEGIPMSVLEAMSFGLPIIAPDVGGFPEIVADCVEGFLIEGRDPLSFADRCVALAQTDLWRTMSRAARDKVVREFSITRMVDHYVETYCGCSAP